MKMLICHSAAVARTFPLIGHLPSRDRQVAFSLVFRRKSFRFISHYNQLDSTQSTIMSPTKLLENQRQFYSNERNQGKDSDDWQLRARDRKWLPHWSTRKTRPNYHEIDPDLCN